MAVAVAVLVEVLAPPPQAVQAGASAQKELRSVLRQHTARAEAAMVVHRQA
jgi:hypothetical protein